MAEIHYCSESDGLTSTLKVDAVSNAQTLSVPVERGDRYRVDASVGNIGFVKIDLGGAEPGLLSGSGELVSPEIIPIVQFEYGRLNTDAKYLLRDFYFCFMDRGYLVGKLLPEGARIREYSPWAEDFLGPSFAAIRSDLAPLLQHSTRV